MSGTGLLLAFAPFIAFAIAARFTAPGPALIAAALIALAPVVREGLHAERSPKILEIGTAVLFGLLALYAVLFRPAWSIFTVRLAVDGGLLLIVLVSLAIRKPFTLQYARERVPREFWERPQFLRANDVITAAWAIAFVLLAAGDASLAYAPQVPPSIAIAVEIVALTGACFFTSWYPKRLRAAALRDAP